MLDYPQFVDFYGERRKLDEVAKEHKINPVTVRERMRLGWSFYRALYTPHYSPK
jgi:hypothetical protein